LIVNQPDKKWFISLGLILYFMELSEYKCYYDSCSKTYKTKYNLRRHINSNHLLIREFTCQFCLKSFASKQNLQGHERTHCKTEDMGELEIPFVPINLTGRKNEEIRELLLSRIYCEKKPCFSSLSSSGINTLSKPILPLICHERSSLADEIRLPVIPILL